MCTSRRPWRFRSTSSEVGPAGGEDPDDLPAVLRVAHLLGQHAVDAAREARVAVAAAALARHLVGLVHEDDDLPEGVEDREDLLEVALGGAHPLLAEVLQLDAGDPDLAGQALDEEGLAGADAAGEQVAHRDRHRAPALEEHRVLAQPGLGLDVAGDVVEGAGGLDELQPARRLLLDELLLHPREVGPGDPLAARERPLHQRADVNAGQADQLLGQDVARHLGGTLELLRVGDEVAPRSRGCRRPRGAGCGSWRCRGSRPGCG